MSAALQAARALARFGWPVLPVAPAGKTPLSRNGVKDATTDDVKIGQWWRKWPDANVGVACGKPGPQVLDIDDLEAVGDKLAELEQTGAPQVATPRGRHFYFAGQPVGTITLGYGELRGTGSYVVAPPSIHPSGKEYVWLTEPNGPLPAAPGRFSAGKHTKGAGKREPVERVSHGERHDHLTDLAVRLVRSGVTEVAAIERALWAEFEAVCDPKPKPRPADFKGIAEWAASSDIAGRERERAKRPAEPAKQRKQTRTLPPTPARDAPLGDLRLFVATAAGLPDVLHVEQVRRFGTRLADAVHIHLSNGLRVEFDAQGDVTTPRVWAKTWPIATSGICQPPTLTGAELAEVLWALCVVSTTTPGKRLESDLEEVVDELVDMAEPVHGTLELEGRYLLLEHLARRPRYDATDKGNARPPALIIDRITGKRYLRAGELRSLADHHRLGITAAQFPGRMRMVGLERHQFRAWDRSDRQRSTRRRTILYELPEPVDEGDDG